MHNRCVDHPFYKINKCFKDVKFYIYNEFMNTSEYLNSTIEYVKNTPLSLRHKNGQYPTPFSIVTELLNIVRDIGINFDEIESILEPSAGTGQFMHKLLKRTRRNENRRIVAMDNDINSINILKEQFSKMENVKIINDDFLTHKFKRKYKLIIGNPPYFETILTKEQKEEFSDVIYGRTNIYTLFIKKCIDLLDDNGVLAFVLPMSMLSGKYFEKLRNYIIRYCNIKKIVLKSTNNFEEVQQQIILLVLKKRYSDKVSEKYIVERQDGKILFSTHYKQLNKLINNTKTIESLDCIVETGKFVRNQNKDLILEKQTKKQKRIRLIWSHNVNNDELNNDKKKNKGIYVKKTDETKQIAITAPFIVCKRIVNKSASCFENVLITEEEYGSTEFICENHVNVIRGDIKNLEIIHKSLLNNKTMEFIEKIIGNTQVSQNELENLIPIFK